MERSLCGLAKVTRQASAYPSAFCGYYAHNCSGVSDVPKGQIIFCLPYVPEDVGWRAVIVTILVGKTEHARLGWIHPECLEPFGLGLEPGTVCVDLTESRGRRRASILIEDDQCPGIREINAPGPPDDGDLVLDARWNMHFHKQTNDCSGHCFSMCKSMLLEPICFAAILRFAAAIKPRGFGRVCCHHGKHRSVAVANILLMLFEVNIDFENAARDRTRECCDHRAADDVVGMLTVLRGLPRISGEISRPLAAILGLPDSGDLRSRMRQ